MRSKKFSLILLVFVLIGILSFANSFFDLNLLERDVVSLVSAEDMPGGCFEAGEGTCSYICNFNGYTSGGTPCQSGTCPVPDTCLTGWTHTVIVSCVPSFTPSPCCGDGTCSGFEDIEFCPLDCAECAEGQTQDCPLQEGVCADSSQTCSGSYWPGCDYSSISNYEFEEVSCDEVDNDCDGEIDEGCEIPCSFSDLDISESMAFVMLGPDFPLFVVDHNGLMWVYSDLAEEWSDVYGDSDFLIQNDAEEVVAWIDAETGILYLLGNLVEESDTLPTDSGNFVVENSLGNPVVWFDNSGNLNLKSCMAEGF